MAEESASLSMLSIPGFIRRTGQRSMWIGLSVGRSVTADWPETFSAPAGQIGLPSPEIPATAVATTTTTTTTLSATLSLTTIVS